ncbi:hypothetical protein [Janthinobacterium sp. CG3]|uniref:hypothetical protein n=1 Tax=Janthinobacterium sp. CG3 TaxID=1075768 RepID=UPI001E2F04C2|nr:hypothetical protein [Janthinobacterium sp. CG3]
MKALTLSTTAPSAPIRAIGKSSFDGSTLSSSPPRRVNSLSAQRAAALLEFQFEQLGGVVGLAQDVAGVVGQRARQRLAGGDRLAQRAGALLPDLVADRAPHRQQQGQGEDGQQ